MGSVALGQMKVRLRSSVGSVESKMPFDCTHQTNLYVVGFYSHSTHALTSSTHFTDSVTFTRSIEVSDLRSPQITSDHLRSPQIPSDHPFPPGMVDAVIWGADLEFDIHFALF